MSNGRIRAPGSWRNPESHVETSLRSYWYRTLLQLQDVMTTATVQFWNTRRVRCGHLPVTTVSVSSPMGLGSDSKPVQVELHGTPTFLADSMQFGLEYMCRLNESGAYYLMPSFRGDDVDAVHLSEFFHSEAEIPGGLDDAIRVVEEYIRHIVGQLKHEAGPLIARVAGGLDHIDALLSRPEPFTRISFEEAVALLDNPAHLYTDEAGLWRSLTRAGERRLMERLGEFVWVTHWDHLAVPFYQAYAADGTQALNADLLFGVGEVVGAGERHTTADAVLRALKEHEVPMDSYEWYVKMRELAPARTSGFGLGVERFLMWLLRHDDIRDMQLLPRDKGRNAMP